jgi:hypothetical protein
MSLNMAYAVILSAQDPDESENANHSTPQFVWNNLWMTVDNLWIMCISEQEPHRTRIRITILAIARVMRRMKKDLLHQMFVVFIERQ